MREDGENPSKHTSSAGMPHRRSTGIATQQGFSTERIAPCHSGALATQTHGRATNSPRAHSNPDDAITVTHIHLHKGTKNQTINRRTYLITSEDDAPEDSYKTKLPRLTMRFFDPALVACTGNRAVDAKLAGNLHRGHHGLGCSLENMAWRHPSVPI